MYQESLYQFLSQKINDRNIPFNEEESITFLMRISSNFDVIHHLYLTIYQDHPKRSENFSLLTEILIDGFLKRPQQLRQLDAQKKGGMPWFTSSELVGMSLYVDRFCLDLSDLRQKLNYLLELGVNFVHLMPLMKSPQEASDGGYAVSDFRQVEPRFGTMAELELLVSEMHSKGMYIMLDIVLNHTSDQHEWARRASAGEEQYEQYFYIYPDREVPDVFEKTMPDIFPDSSPGSFTFDVQSGKWVMSVFNSYQWDLNYTNPEVFVRMLEHILFYANLGVDVLRIDAPAFIWKKIGTACQNLPEAHTILQLIKHCVQSVAPGMALLGEAIVAPAEIMKYFGTGSFMGRECDLAYNATQMALQWDALATGDVRVMMAAQRELLKKPLGTTWITYTRCHDDIGLGYDDSMIQEAGFQPMRHREFLKAYYSGQFPGSPARGALFGVNPKTNDARISGTLASLCGLESALEKNQAEDVELSIRKIILMQAQSLFIGGIPVLFYGDECGYLNDYSYQKDPSKNYDNRWMHRPAINWERNQYRLQKGSIEFQIFSKTQKLIRIRKGNSIFSDTANLVWLSMQNIHIAGFKRSVASESIICLFNFSDKETGLTWYALKEAGWPEQTKIKDLWSGLEFQVGKDDQHLVFQPYQFMVLVKN